MPKKKTHETFEKEVDELGNQKYELLSRYAHSKMKVSIKHMTCGNKYWVTPDKFLLGQRCPLCKNKKQVSMDNFQEKVGEKRRSGVRKAHETFLREVMELEASNYQVISNYINANTPVWVKHVKCGEKFQVNPNRFLSGRRCSKCSTRKNKRKTHDEFEQLVNEQGKNEYEVLSHYKNSTTHVQMKHIPCGHTYAVTPNAFQQGKRCANCSNKIQRKTHETFLNEVKTLGQGEYTLLSTYTRSRDYVKMRHDKCGYEYNVLANEFVSGTRCSNCFNKNKKSPEVFKEEVEKTNEYQLLTPYETTRKKVKIKHIACGKVYEVLPRNFSTGNRCPRCKISKGERMVEKTLKKVGLEFTPQIRFEDCRNIYPLPFDFGVRNERGEIVFLIEYDGEQHYEENDFYGGRESYLQRVRNDRIKSNYAKDNGIPLLRIRYDQKYPELLLKHVLEKFRFDIKSDANVSHVS